ncbi:hypothetical protein RYX36_028134 [Vicia faba]
MPKNMYKDVSSCNTYDYGDAVYWDARYIQEGGSFDWYHHYSNLKPFLRHYFPLSSTILMVGCSNAGSYIFVLSSTLMHSHITVYLNTSQSSSSFFICNNMHISTPSATQQHTQKIKQREDAESR